MWFSPRARHDGTHLQCAPQSSVLLLSFASYSCFCKLSERRGSEVRSWPGASRKQPSSSHQCVHPVCALRPGSCTRPEHGMPGVSQLASPLPSAHCPHNALPFRLRRLLFYREFSCHLFCTRRGNGLSHCGIEYFISTAEFSKSGPLLHKRMELKVISTN